MNLGDDTTRARRSHESPHDTSQQQSVLRNLCQYPMRRVWHRSERHILVRLKVRNPKVQRLLSIYHALLQTRLRWLVTVLLESPFTHIIQECYHIINASMLTAVPRVCGVATRHTSQRQSVLRNLCQYPMRRVWHRSERHILVRLKVPRWFG
jgi:uncharacterized protein (DUF2336 family)